MKSTQCILCSSKNIKYSHKIEYDGNFYLYDFCNDCHFTFQNPWPSKDIEEIYNDNKYWNSSNVYKKNEKRMFVKNSYADYQNSRIDEAKKRYNQLNKYFKKKGKVLEIGCANGIFLNEWKKNGWNCIGVDPAKEMIDYGIQNFKLDLYSQNWESTKLDNNSLDCIFMWGTDGNFYEFENGFININRTLKLDGIYALTYQDFLHPIRRLFKQIRMQHNSLYNFSKRSIYYLLKKIGFEVLDHSMTWQNTKFSHIKKILGVNTSGLDFKITVPAISYNLIIAKKIRNI